MADEDLVDIAISNGEEFLRVWKRFEVVDTFLHREDDEYYLSLRSVNASAQVQKELMSFSYDTDGVVIEWKKLQHISHPVRQLNFNTDCKLKNTWNLLHKHVCLHRYSSSALHGMKLSVGFQMMYEYGWEYWLSIFPNENLDSLYQTQVDIKGKAKASFKKIKCAFQRQLNEASSRGVARKSLDKNNFGLTSKLSIQPDDQVILLEMLQNAIDSVTPSGKWRILVFSFRFGEKNSKPVYVPYHNSEAVSNLSVHTGVNIAIPEYPVDLFWSRTVLQELIGNRGSLIPTLSLYECASYQSNLDGLKLDLSHGLRTLSYFPEDITFLQFYADVPHRYPRTRAHPVSGSIVCNSSVFHQTRHSLEKDSATYLSESSQNFFQMHKSECRLEIVVRLDEEIPGVIQPKDFLNEVQLKNFLHENALMVPIALQEKSFVKYISEVGLAMVGELERLYSMYKMSGNFAATWRSFQLELGIEKVLWGRPLCSRVSQWSVNLGPGLLYPSRSKTDRLAMIAFEEDTTCISDETQTPPLAIWSDNPVTQRKISRAFGFQDHLDSAPHVLGRRYVTMLLEDLYDIGVKVGYSRSEFLLRLKGQSQIVPEVVGSITVTQIARKIADCDRGKGCMVSLAMRDMLSRAEVDLYSLVKSGIEELGLKCFPAIRVFDDNRNSVLNWLDSYKYNAISDTTTSRLAYQGKSSRITQLVLQEMENRKLTYTSQLRSFHFNAFPWVVECLRKLEHLNLPEDDLVTEMTFISCVGLLQNNYFVDYYKLRALEYDLKVKQDTLRKLEIQSKFLLPFVNCCKVWRLHHSLTIKMEKPSITVPKKDEKDRTTREEVPEDISSGFFVEGPHESDAMATVHRVDVRHLPAGCPKQWSPEEEDIVKSVQLKRLNSFKVAYDIYLQLCKEHCMPDRSLGAFRWKYYQH